MMNRTTGRGARGGSMSQSRQAGRGRGQQRSPKPIDGRKMDSGIPPRTTRRSTRIKNREESDGRNKQTTERTREADNPFEVLSMEEDEESEIGEKENEGEHETEVSRPINISPRRPAVKRYEREDSLDVTMRRPTTKGKQDSTDGKESMVEEDQYMLVQEQATTQEDELRVHDERMTDLYRYESIVSTRKKGEGEKRDKEDVTMSMEDDELERWNEALKANEEIEESDRIEKEDERTREERTEDNRQSSEEEEWEEKMTAEEVQRNTKRHTVDMEAPSGGNRMRQTKKRQEAASPRSTGTEEERRDKLRRQKEARLHLKKAKEARDKGIDIPPPMEQCHASSDEDSVATQPQSNTAKGRKKTKRAGPFYRRKKALIYRCFEEHYPDNISIGMILNYRSQKVTTPWRR
jgi:hypothetical protein